MTPMQAITKVFEYHLNDTTHLQRIMERERVLAMMNHFLNLMIDDTYKPLKGR